LSESAVVFGKGAELVGVITEPEVANVDLPAFVFLNAGVTHRIGPSRLHVRLARELAKVGHVVMRFDFSGLGDSSRRTDDLPVAESVILESREAMDVLEKTRGIKRFVLIGICSGATISYLTSKEDDRVMGVVLVNAQSHLHGMDPDLGEYLRDKTMGSHSWRIALKSSFRKKNIRKAIGGQLNPVRIMKMMIGMPMALLFKNREEGASAKAYDSAADLRAVTERGVKLFHLYSEGDEGLDYFNVVLNPEEREECNRGNSRFEMMPGANHVFTLLWSQDALVDSVLNWAKKEAR
jgi:hypothetical protein